MTEKENLWNYADSRERNALLQQDSLLHTPRQKVSWLKTRKVQGFEGEGAN